MSKNTKVINCNPGKLSLVLWGIAGISFSLYIIGNGVYSDIRFYACIDVKNYLDKNQPDYKFFQCSDALK